MLNRRYNMKKILVLIFTLVCCTGTGMAQGQAGIGANGGVALPLGDFGTAFSTGFGGNGILFFELSPGIEISGSVGYYVWKGEDSFFFDMYKYTLTSIPLLIGGRYYFGDGPYMPYGAIEGGLHFVKSETKVAGITILESETRDVFGFGVGGGILFAVGRTMSIDIGVKYNSFEESGITSDYLSLMAGVRTRF
jgi:hypothetical protein